VKLGSYRRIDEDSSIQNVRMAKRVSIEKINRFLLYNEREKRIMRNE
jgi:hypothetical protein